MTRIRPLRVLFVCTGNSARSQMAEGILNAKGQGRFEAASAGSQPAKQVNPLAIETLREFGMGWSGHAPRSVEGLEREHWDVVITVCDRAKESCPIFPGQPVTAHWSMSDPTDRADFREAFLLLSRRIDLLLALPIEKLERLALETRVQTIGVSASQIGTP